MRAGQRFDFVPEAAFEVCFSTRAASSDVRQVTWRM